MSLVRVKSCKKQHFLKLFSFEYVYVTVTLTQTIQNKYDARLEPTNNKTFYNARIQSIRIAVKVIKRNKLLFCPKNLIYSF